MPVIARRPGIVGNAEREQDERALRDPAERRPARRALAPFRERQGNGEPDREQEQRKDDVVEPQAVPGGVRELNAEKTGEGGERAVAVAAHLLERPRHAIGADDREDGAAAQGVERENAPAMVRVTSHVAVSAWIAMMRGPCRGRVPGRNRARNGHCAGSRQAGRIVRVAATDADQGEATTHCGRFHVRAPTRQGTVGAD